MNSLFPHLFLGLPPEEVGDWKSALLAEADLRSGRGEAPQRPLRSLFVAAGARGTEAWLARDILDVVGAELVGSATEWTVEVEVPGTDISCSPEVIRAWGDAGVNRVSLALPFTYPRTPVPGGVPTLFGAHLESRLGAASRLLSGGIRVVNVDVPLATGQGRARAGVQEALRIAHALERIGVPQLAIREWDGGEYGEGGEGARGPEEEDPEGVAVAAPETTAVEVAEPDDVEGWACLRGRLLEFGFESGDGVHFSRRGPMAVHARAILRREAVLGLGPAAVTFRNPERRGNVPEWRGYRSRALAGMDPLGWRERLSRAEVRIERVWSRLRSREGLRVGGLGSRSTRLIGEWVVREWATMEGGRVILLPEGWIRMDGLVVDLLRTADLDQGMSPPPLS